MCHGGIWVHLKALWNSKSFAPATCCSFCCCSCRCCCCRCFASQLAGEINVTCMTPRKVCNAAEKCRHQHQQEHSPSTALPLTQSLANFFCFWSKKQQHQQQQQNCNCGNVSETLCARHASRTRFSLSCLSLYSPAKSHVGKQWERMMKGKEWKARGMCRRTTEQGSTVSQAAPDVVVVAWPRKMALQIKRVAIASSEAVA